MGDRAAVDPNFCALCAAAAQAGHGGLALPRVEGLPGAVLARAVLRRVLDDEGRWRPAVELQPEAPSAALAAGLAAAAGGWALAAPGPWAPGRAARLAADAARLGARLLWVDAGPDAQLPQPVIDELLRLDPHHAVAVDPGLAELRGALLAHCRSAGVVHLAGPPGVGKRALAAWAHARLDDQPAAWIGPAGARAAPPGRWPIISELTELDVDQRQALLQALRARDLRPPSLRPAPARAGARPVDPAFAPILGESAPLVALLRQAMRAAPSGLSLLLLGEPGTGKEELARALHRASGRRGPLVAVDLSAGNTELVEAALFGQRKGAFTGADRDRPGAFRQADGGTLFLDELGNLPLRVQAKLLRALQERAVVPLGADMPQPVDVRVIAATNADLDGMVARGELRADLLHRLDGMRLELPPLRERGADLDLLADRLLAEAAPGRGLRLSTAARARLHAWPWPGNVRELRNLMGQAALGCEGSLVEPAQLGPLAPAAHRPVPLISLSADLEPLRAGQGGLPRAALHRLTATTLAVPPLRERGRSSLRCAILHALGSQAATPEALALLEARPWWGELPELHAAAAALRAAGLPVVDAEAVRRLLPAGPAGAPPIRALLAPSRRDDGEIIGLQQDVHAPALVIGRAPGWGPLLRALRAVPAEAPRLAALLAAVGDGTPELLSLPYLPGLSRAHLVVRRAEGGLYVAVLLEARLLVQVAPYAGGAPRRLGPGEGAAVGPAAGLTLLGPDGSSPLLRLSVFLGPVAFAEHAAAALVAERPPPRATCAAGAPGGALGAPAEGGARPQAWDDLGPAPGPAPSPWAEGAAVSPRSASAAAADGAMAAGSPWAPPGGDGCEPTLPGPRGANAPGPLVAPAPASAVEAGLVPGAPRPRLWVTTSAEDAVLASVIASFRGGDLSAHLRAALGAAGPTAARLAAYILPVRPSQYLARLCAHPPNQCLRAEINAQVDAAADGLDPALRRALLPKAVVEALG
ncbi:MAG: sigma-54-dependent Fis family transcriptional regulator [Deltaproteobacteria bacterium]|nr:sigma-54-dependent Fis family transcriptional regulator [Deltaproteobacteria bacterium]